MVQVRVSALREYYRPPFEYYQARTNDDYLLYCKRYPRRGAQPILLVHGLAQNQHSFDLPIGGHNLAHYLHGAGFDVWLPNLRSHGRPPFRSKCSGKWDWSIDDHALRDLPALIDMVTEQTGQTPYYIGHSMGGMMLLMYLQGAQLEPDSPRVTQSDAARDLRHKQLAGAITLGSPVLLKWRSGGGLRWLSQMIDTRMLMRLFGGHYWLRNLLTMLGYAPTRRLLGEIAGSPRLHWISLRKLLSGPVGQANKLLSKGHIWHPDNMTDEIFRSALSKTMEHCCAKVLVQFLDWIAHGTFREFPHRGAGALHDYAAGLGRVELPLLMVTGQHDHFVDQQVLQRLGFAPLASADKSLVILPNTGHADILYGRHSPATVYPMLVAWIKKRCPQIRVDETKRLPQPDERPEPLASSS